MSRGMIIPKNKKGEQDAEYGYFDSLDIEEIDMSEEEIHALYNSGVFSTINSEFELLIDPYEDETIPAKAIRRCKEILEEKGFHDTAFMKGIDTAIKYNTFIDLYL